MVLRRDGDVVRRGCCVSHGQEQSGIIAGSAKVNSSASRRHLTACLSTYEAVVKCFGGGVCSCRGWSSATPNRFAAVKPPCDRKTSRVHGRGWTSRRGRSHGSAGPNLRSILASLGRAWRSAFTAIGAAAACTYPDTGERRRNRGSVAPNCASFCPVGTSMSRNPCYRGSTFFRPLPSDGDAIDPNHLHLFLKLENLPYLG